MNRAERRRQKKQAEKANKKKDRGLLATSETPLSIEQMLAIKQGLALQAAGQLLDAESIYRDILKSSPNQPDALHLLGLVTHQLGKNDVAVDLFAKCIGLRSDFAEAHKNLGAALKQLGRLDEAVASYRMAIEIRPNYVDAHNNLGIALKEMDKLEDAITSYHKALDFDPNDAKIHNNLAASLHKKGELKRAETHYDKAITLNPEFFEAYNNLGFVLREQGRLDEAQIRCHKALALNPGYAEAHNNLGLVLQELGKLDEALASLNKAIELNPDFAEAYANRGIVFKNQGLLDDAVESFRSAIGIKPDFAMAYNNLANTHQEQGRLGDAIANYQKALEIKPDYASAHSNLLFAEQYRPGHTAKSLYELHREWDENHGKPLRNTWPRHQNTPDPDRRLRVGFVSPDLGRHPVGYFIDAMLKSFSGLGIDTICYSDHIADDLTDQIKGAADLWKETRGLSDMALSKTILADQIDILIDLCGHSADNRLLTLARKPAPVQMTWAGYVGTTGLSSIDYIVSDRYSTESEEEVYYSEKTVRMPDSWLCYAPPPYACDVGPLPSAQKEYVTFGSFSNPAKINEDVVSVWADILKGVDNSRLIIKYRSITSKFNSNRLITLFEAAGVDRSRLVLEDKSFHAELFKRYNDVDIALDPFPYSGGITTYEALWMGVPVITVPGATFASRHSLSHLSTIGLQAFVAKDRQDYVALAIEHAANPQKLSELRSNLRQMMVNSPVCDGKTFSKNFEILVRNAWQNWCKDQSSNRQNSL